MKQSLALGRRLFRDRNFRWGFGLISIIVVVALAAPTFSGWSPDVSDIAGGRASDGSLAGPSKRHLFGVDPLMRDVLARLAEAARTSLFIGTSATLLSLALGTCVGISAGFCAGSRFDFADRLLMRLVDVLFAIPFVLLASAIGVAIGQTDALTVVLVLGSFGWGFTARLVRSKAVEVRGLVYVEAARALGATPWSIARRHVLPSVLPMLVVLAASSMAHMILAESALSYLAVGVAPPRATWGRMLREAEPYLTATPRLVAGPGLAILLTVIATSRIGDALRGALDPRRVRRPQGRIPFDLVVAAAALGVVLVASPPRLRAPQRRAEVAIAPARGGAIHLATASSPRTLDPAMATEELAVDLGRLVFSRLVTWNDAGALVPALAEAFQIAPDGRRVTLTLRQRLLFHDGNPLRAADVVRSFERALHPKTPSPIASSFSMLQGAAEFHRGKTAHIAGLRALSEHVVQFDLDQPDATFLPLLAMGFASPVCASMGEYADPKRPVTLCGAGPFRLATWSQEEGGRLVRHDGYHDLNKPRLDEVFLATNMRASTQRYAFEDGRLDLLREVGGADAALFKSDPAWAKETTSTERAITYAVFLNAEVAPFTSRAMRRAVALALDPSALERVRADVSENDRVIPASIPGPTRDAPMRRHDESLALRAMAEAGHPFDPSTGRGGYPNPIDYLAVADSFGQQAAEIFQQQLARVGVKIRLRLVSPATYLAESSRRRASAMGACAWGADFPDPASMFEPTLSAAAIADEGSGNVAFFANSELDAALARGRSELDPVARMVHYQTAESIVRDEAPWVPTHTSKIVEVRHPYVRGYAPHALLGPRLEDVWLDRSSARATRASLGPLGSIANHAISATRPFP